MLPVNRLKNKGLKLEEKAVTDDVLHQWILDIAENRDGGWDSLWNSNLGKDMRGYCRKVAEYSKNKGSLEPLDEEDLFEDCRYAIRDTVKQKHTNPGGLNDIKAVKNYFWRIVRNICASRIRKVIQMQRVSSQNPKKDILDILAGSNNNLGQIEASLRFARLVELADLNQMQAELIEQIKRGKTPEEVAKESGSPINTVRTRLRRIYLKLRNAENNPEL